MNKFFRNTLAFVAIALTGLSFAPSAMAQTTLPGGLVPFPTGLDNTLFQSIQVNLFNQGAFGAVGQGEVLQGVGNVISNAGGNANLTTISGSDGCVINCSSFRFEGNVTATADALTTATASSTPGVNIPTIAASSAGGSVQAIQQFGYTITPVMPTLPPAP